MFEDLPSARVIDREAFSAPEFNVDAFLFGYHEFQTLEDLHGQLKQWSTIVQQQLVDVINENYEEFVGLGKSLEDGQSKVQDLKMEVLGFKREISKELEISSKELDGLIKQKMEYSKLQNLLQLLISYGERVNQLEDQIKDPDLTTSGIKYLTNCLSTIESMKEELPTNHVFVQSQNPRVSALRHSLLALFKSKASELEGQQLFELLIAFRQIGAIGDGLTALKHHRANGYKGNV